MVPRTGEIEWLYSTSEGRCPATPKVRNGSWLSENAETLEHDRRSYSSKIVLALKLASALNLDDKLKNEILVALRSFAFLHSQGQKATSFGF